MKPYIVAVLFSVYSCCAFSFQYEIVSATGNYIVLKEYVKINENDKTPCQYADLDSSLYQGDVIHLINMQKIRHGKVLYPLHYDESFALHEPRDTQMGCLNNKEVQLNIDKLQKILSSKGVDINSKPIKQLLIGAGITDRQCSYLSGKVSNLAKCHYKYETLIDKHALKIFVDLYALSEYPDLSVCQFIGYRFGAAIQIKWLDFGATESPAAPAGFVDHYDCRRQKFLPLRLSVFEDDIILLGSFQGDNIADSAEHAFIIAFPRYSN